MTANKYNIRWDYNVIDSVLIFDIEIVYYHY